MKRIKKWMGGVIVTLGVMVLSFPVYAADLPSTSILPASWGDKDGILNMLKFVLEVLFYGLGAVAIIGTVIAGILYLTARDNEQQVAKAKKRLFEISLGLVAWGVMFTVLKWLIPGGVRL